MDKKERRLYEFDRFCLDASERILLHDQQETPLTPKVFETLLLLVENSGRVIGKEELLQTIWPDSFVEESSLTQNISLLRKALGEGGEGRRLIEKIQKRGYKFIAPVRVVNGGSAAGEAPPERSAAPEAAIKEGNERHTDRQEEVAPRADLPPTFSAFPANLNSGRKVAVVILALSLAIAGVAYLLASKPQGAVSAEGGNKVRSLAALPFRSEEHTS